MLLDILGTKEEGGLRHTHLGEVGLYQRTTGDVKGLFVQQSHHMGEELGAKLLVVRLLDPIPR
jgi:hypothetical protein